MDPSEVFGDRTIVLKLLEKQREIRQREENVKLYQDTYDPRQPGALVKYQQLHSSIDRQTLKELGYDHCTIDWNNFPGIDDLIILYFEKDEEIMKMLGYSFINGSMYGDVLDSPISDVGLISLASKEVLPLSRLHLHKEKPLLIIASSLS
ncbi:uncharacterized protein [Amphiura filiformis]|uniref:uncharacterized protein n=1 Tax=Amphiura filiformis TaxID=82378 RepID=UPI003B21FA1D